MKVISLQISEKELLKKALRKERGAQKALYDKYSPKMLSVCRMYVRDLHFAEDVLLKGFLKVFSNLKKFRNEGSFEGWVRKIMVREAIDFLRSQKRHGFTEEFEERFSPVVFSGPEASEGVEELQHQIDQLPQGYKTVLMLYAVEGYKHQEISKMLQISEGTSKSQLSKARKMLKEKLAQKAQKNENRSIR